MTSTDVTKPLKFDCNDVTFRRRRGESYEIAPSEIPLRYDGATDELFYATKNDYDLSEACLRCTMTVFWIVKELYRIGEAERAGEIARKLLALREELR